MIDAALLFIEESLNEYFKYNFDINEDKILSSNILNQDGTLALKEQNKIVATIVNIQEERMLKSGSRVYGEGSFNEKGYYKPPIYLNLYLLFSVQFEPQLLPEGLKFLSILIGYFQMKNVFTSQSSANLPVGIEKIIMEMENLSFQEQNNLWGALGCKYVPSVLYKMRMLTISENVLIQSGTEITSRKG